MQKHEIRLFSKSNVALASLYSGDFLENMDERQRDNLAAVACHGGLGLLGLCPAQPDALEFLSLAVKAAGYTVHDEFVLCGIAGTSHLGCVDPLLANRTRAGGRGGHDLNGIPPERSRLNSLDSLNKNRLQYKNQITRQILILIH